jgi:hypothetical protein
MRISLLKGGSIRLCRSQTHRRCLRTVQSGEKPRSSRRRRAGLKRPHQLRVRARPNCQSATSMGYARMSQRPGSRLRLKQSEGADNKALTLSSAPRAGILFETDSFPPPSLQPRLPFSVKRTEFGRGLPATFAAHKTSGARGVNARGANRRRERPERMGASRIASVWGRLVS